jgi:hypothetical protein
MAESTAVYEDERQAAGRPSASAGGLARYGALSLAALAVGVAAAGQAATSRDFDARLDLLAGTVRRIHLKDVYGEHPRTVLFAGVLLVVAAVVFAVATREDGGAPLFDGAAPRWVREALRRRAVAAWAGLLTVGAVIAAYVDMRLLRDEYRPFLVWWFVLAIVLIGRGIAMAPWRAARPDSVWPRPWEWALVGAATAYFLVVNVRDADSWRYAAIGDEYAFFSFAKAMQARTLHPDVFSQFGVYNQRPVGTSGLQAASMAVFGDDNFGWHLATPIALAATIPPLYVLARELFDRTVAAFATAIFALSHYLLSYAHTVYDNVFAILPFTWCMALAVVGLRRSSPVWLYGAGVVGGLGFYTFPTARMAPIVLALFLATLGRRVWHPGILLPLGAGLLVAGLPLFAADGWDAISVSRDRTVFGFTPDHEHVWIRILQNVPRSSIVWSYNPNPGHFVSGSLLDPVSAVLLVLGLGFGLARVRHQAYRLLGIWLGVTLLFAGLFSPYDRAPYDRLHLLLPVVAIYAGLALAAITRVAGRAVPRWPAAAPAFGVALVVVLSPPLAYLNLHRFLVESPRVTPSTEERIALGGIFSSPCRGATRTLVVIRQPKPLLDPALDSFGLRRDITTRATDDAATSADFADFGCVVITRPKATSAAAPGGAAELAGRVQRDYGFRQAGAISSPVLPLVALVLVRG